MAGALAAARRDRLSAGDPAASWAGLVVLGDGGLVVRRAPGEDRSARTALAVVAAAVAAALAWLYRRRRYRPD
jgi:hypothetical protein